jgi:hypothetical protein
MALSFGIEIELIANPHFILVGHKRKEYYEVLAQSLRDNGLKSRADRLIRYKKHPEHYDKWWITKDGSLRNPKYPRGK